ncbi:MAG: tyrosinase family protein [Bacteroidia bacterium]|nr:tyrosinase family protein [Bacteroidia bacterium]
MHTIYTRCLLIICCVATLHIRGTAQIIRKNYLEFATSEKTDYVGALNLVWAGGVSTVGKGTHFADIHGSHFGTNIHSMRGDGSNFTSFHRFMLLHYELMLRTSAPQYDYLALPFWDWRNDPPKNIALPITASNSPNFWYFDMLNLNKFTGWGVTRGAMLSDLSSLPTQQTFATAITSSTFWSLSSTSFSRVLEGSNHNGAHVWVGGTMGTGASPRDPIFFIHHCMVDKIWQMYEDETTGLQSNYPTTNYIIPSYNKQEGWVDDLYADNTKDSRKIPFRYLLTQPVTNYDVWYADKGAVILDGANGIDFLVLGINKVYRYTAFDYISNTLKGKMYVGDYKRDATNAIVADIKGGFVVNAGNVCHFRAGEEITFGPGTTLTAGAGTDVTAKIITTPNGF